MGVQEHVDRLVEQFAEEEDPATLDAIEEKITRLRSLDRTT